MTKTDFYARWGTVPALSGGAEDWFDSFWYHEPSNPGHGRISEPARQLRDRIAARRMRILWLVGALLIGVHAYAAPPPDASGKYSDWFQSLTVPGIPNLGCCSAADCRMVDSRWNTETQRHEARVIREVFSNALKNSVLYLNDHEAFEVAKRIWIKKWIDRFGDTPEAWIEIPETRINHTSNPTGRAVLCWSTFVLHHFNGVFCFVPFEAAFNDYVDHTQMLG